MSDLVEHFHNRFEVLTAETDEVRDLAFQLRYQVYCVERGHAAEVITRDCRETDPFDSHALHIVIRDRRVGNDKATARLVVAGAMRDELFPIEHSYPDLLAQHGIGEDLLPRGRTAEISRFAISKEFRERRAPEQKVANAATDRLDSRVRDLPGGASNRRPLVTFGLLLGLIRLGEVHDITHCLAVMEPSLLRLLARFGIRFIPIGEPVEYHGRRQPCYACVKELVAGIRAVQPELWRLLSDTQLPDVSHTSPPSFQVRVPFNDQTTYKPVLS